MICLGEQVDWSDLLQQEVGVYQPFLRQWVGLVEHIFGGIRDWSNILHELVRLVRPSLRVGGISLT